jgi:hypothetical protein
VALQITDNLKQQLDSPQISPVMVAKVDGYQNVFGNINIKRYIKIGDPGLVIDGSWVIGGFSLLDNQSPYISFSTGTTTKISQKLEPSRGQGSSVSQMVLSLLDQNESVSELVSPGKVLTEMMGRRITIYLGAQESSWPEDYNVVFRGIVQEINAGPGIVELVLNNTEEKKRVTLAPKITSELSQDVQFRSAQVQDLLYKNKEDVANSITVNYTSGGTAGAEVVSISGGGYTINVQIEAGVSTASQIKKAVENDDSANQLIEIKINGNSSNTQIVGSYVLGTSSIINLNDATEFIEPIDALETFAVIGDELIQYTGKTGSQLTGVTRALAGTNAEFHAQDKSISQVLKLTGNGIDLALKIMLSKGPVYYEQGLSVRSFQTYTPSIVIDDAIFFYGVDLEVDLGVSAGDLLTTTGAVNPANNVTDAIILEVGKAEGGSYIVVSSNLVNEPSPSACTASFKSQYNVLPIGFGMLPVEVDVAQHAYVRDTFLPIFPMELFFDNVTDGKGFLETQVYLPMTCFSVPRKGRSSIVYTVGPLPTYEVVLLDSKTVENPQALKVRRSLHENFFNQVQYDYDYNPVKNNYDTRKNYPQVVDKTKIAVEAKPLSIQAQGLTSSGGGADRSERAAFRLLKRYSGAAEFIKGVRVLFSKGYQLEIGDVVAVDYADLKLTDFSSGTRSGPLKLMEVLNKTIDNKSGEVSIDLVNTVFGVNDRYGLISPSSKVGTGSTTTKIILQKSWSTRPFEKESKKWNGYLDQTVIVHSEDWSTVYVTKLRGFDTNDPIGMSVDTLPTAPGDGWIVQPPDYPSSSDDRLESFWKQRHAFFSPRVAVLSGVSSTQFTVSSLDAARFFIGSYIRVHTYNFSQDSGDLVVIDIQGNNIYVDNSIGFVPDNTHVVDLIGFPDKQQSYRVV